MNFVKQLLSVVSCRVKPRRFKYGKGTNLTTYSEHEAMPTHLREYAVSSPILDQLEQKCEKIRPIPTPHAKVTIVGAATDIGLITSLFLKQHHVIKTVAMYEDFPQADTCVIGHANDIAHIDTSTTIEAYQGKSCLPMALNDAQVVLLCGGCYACAPGVSDRTIFQNNASKVRWYADMIARFAPNAIVCVQIPPVDANFNVVRHTLKQCHVYNKRKLLGVNSITAMRANQLYCAMGDLDPLKSYCPCIGGTGRCSRVPVFSTMDQYVCLKTSHKHQLEVITRLVREADDLISKVKCSHERAHLSMGFSTARMVTNIFHGLWGGKGFIDSALVEQHAPASCYGMKVCACPVNICDAGISTYTIPKLAPGELEMLETSKSFLEDMLYMGKCFVMGDDYCPCYSGPYVACEECPEAEQPPPKLAKKC